MSSPDSPALLEDYKLKATFANSVVGRVLTEFQIMVTLETAVATGLILTATGDVRHAARWIVLLLIVISVAWAVAAWVAVGRSKVSQQAADDAGMRWAHSAGYLNSDPGASAQPDPSRYQPVGTGQNSPKSAKVVPIALALIWAALGLWVVK